MTAKNLIFCGILLAVCQNLFAQFGAHGGMAISSMKITVEDAGQSETERLDSRIGLALGAYYRYQAGAQFAIQPEINLVQRGGKSSVDFLGQQLKTDFRLNYIEIPINFLYTATEFEGFYVGGGPSFNVGLGGTLQVDFAGESQSENIEFGSDGDFKGFLLGGNLIAGYQFLNGLNVSGFYTHGFSNIAAQEAIDEDNANIKLSNFGIRIGYTFGGGGMAKAKNGLKVIF